MAIAVTFPDIGENGVGFRDFFLGFGLQHRTQPVPVAVQYFRHAASGGQHIVRKSLRSQLLDGFLGRQARERQGRAKRRVLLGMTFRQFPQGLRHLRVFLLPQFRTAAERVEPQTNDPGTFLMQTELHGLPTPAENVLGTPSTATAIFQRHLRLKRPAVRPRHLARSKPDIFKVDGFKRNLPFSYRGNLHQQYLQSQNRLEVSHTTV